jgi:hypothetical protein
MAASALGQTLPSDGRTANDRLRVVSGSPSVGHVLPLSAETGHSRGHYRAAGLDPLPPFKAHVAKTGAVSRIPPPQGVAQ